MQDQISPPPVSNNPVLSLSELSASLKKTVESVYDQVRVRAEISRPTRAASGHVYFTLKDENTTLDAVCWKTVAGQLSIQPEEGLDVVATGKLTIYPGRSKYQIVIKDIELAGEGALLKQLEERKKRLAAEGLFDGSRKQALPAMPQVIGVVTSPTGAVIRDILHRLEERFPTQVYLWPVMVQGDGAADQISAAIAGFDALLDQENPAITPPDVVIVARGGGSLEDLMAFNEEQVVRAAAACRLPLISAVGHETDHTLIDLAADLRAPTPTAAAELAVPVKAELSARIADLDGRLTRNLGQQFERSSQVLRSMERALGDPEMLLSSKSQRLDLAFSGLDRRLETKLNRFGEVLRQQADRLPLPSEQLRRAASALSDLDLRVAHAIGQRLTRSQSKLSAIADRMTGPGEELTRGASKLDLAVSRLESQIDQWFTRHQNRFQQASRLLEAGSFQRILEKGFALVTGPDGQVMKTADQYQDGAVVRLQLAQGERDATLGQSGEPSSPKAPSKKVAVKKGSAKKESASENSGAKNSEQGDLF